MLVHHPLTGKPIRILKTEAHIYKNQKTLLWLREKSYPDSDRFGRWDTLVFGHELAHIWKACASAIVLRQLEEKTLEWILTSAPRSQQILFFSKEVIQALGVERAKVMGFVNIICLEELGEIYPHLLRVYSTEDTDVDVALMVACLFRASRLLGVTEDVPLAALYKERYGLVVGPHDVPEPLWLIQQHYVSKRSKELKVCLEENLKNSCIDKVVLLNEGTMKLPSHPKLSQIVLGHRLAYSDIVRYIQDSVPSGVIVAFANADIYLTETFRELWSVSMKDVFMGLLRYEANGELFGPRPDSQDTWIVHSDSVKSRVWDMASLDFQFGRAGCDNAIGVEFLRQKFVVANPCLSLKTMHVHQSEIRTYNPKECIDKPMYLYLEPGGIHDLEPKENITSLPWVSGEYDCRIHAADERTLKTFCAMAARDETTVFEPFSQNTVTPSESLYNIQDGFVTPTSLVYTYKSMILTKNTRMREQWVSAQIGHMTPCLGVKSVLAVPFDFNGAYCLQYVSKILRLRAAGYTGDFWMPRGKGPYHEWLRMFQWNEERIPVLPRDMDVSAFAENVTMLTPSEPCKDDVEALRSAFTRYSLEPSGPKRIVILQDDVLLTTAIVASVEKSLEENGYQVDVLFPKRSSPSILVESLLGAHGCVSGPGCSDLFWVLPRGVRAVDCMSETGISGESVRIAGACSVEYWVVLLPRGKPEAIGKICSEKVLKSLL
jgi:hypothetical protein